MVLAAAVTRAPARAAPASRPDVADIRTVPRQPTEGQADKGVHVEFIQTTLDGYPVLSHGMDLISGVYRKSTAGNV